MNNYIDAVLTVTGAFCVAPPWSVEVGDFIGLENVLTGKIDMLEVVAVSTDEKGGEHIKMLEKYIGRPLPRITSKYKRSEVLWDEDVQE